MPDRRFFEHRGPVSLADLAKAAGFTVPDPGSAGCMACGSLTAAVIGRSLAR